MRKRVLPVILLLLSLLLTVGVKTFMGPCVHEDGSAGSCTWAAQAVFGNGLVLCALSLLLVLVPGLRRGLALGVLGLSLETACLPGLLIRLCLMDTMRCQAVMRPAVLVLCVLTGLLGLLVFLTEKPAKR